MAKMKRLPAHVAKEARATAKQARTWRGHDWLLVCVGVCLIMLTFKLAVLAPPDIVLKAIETLVHACVTPKD